MKWSLAKSLGRIRNKREDEVSPKILVKIKTVLKPTAVAKIPPKAPAKPAAKPIPVLSRLHEKASRPLSMCLVKIPDQLGMTQAIAKPLKHSNKKMCQIWVEKK